MAEQHRTVEIHPTAIVAAGASLGPGVTIGPFCNIGCVRIGENTEIRSYVELRDGTEIGARCYIDSGVKSSGSNRIGDDVTVRYDAILARGVCVDDESFIAPQVMTINLDHLGQEIGGALIGKRCHIGTAAVLHPGIEICDDVVVGAKALVTKDCDTAGVYMGIPAKWVRSRDERGAGI